METGQVLNSWRLRRLVTLIAVGGPSFALTTKVVGGGADTLREGMERVDSIGELWYLAGSHWSHCETASQAEFFPPGGVFYGIC